MVERQDRNNETGGGSGLLTAQQLADYLEVPIATLYAWRYRHEGPPGFRVGRHLRYQWRDVETWIVDQMGRSTRHVSGLPSAAGGLADMTHRFTLPGPHRTRASTELP